MTNEKEKNHKSPQVYIVEEGEGARLDRWLKKQIPNLKQSVLEKLLRLGRIRVNDQKVKAGERLELGQVVTVYDDIEKYTASESAPPKPKKEIPLTSDEMAWFESLIVWEDDRILVLNKPSGLSVQGGTKTTNHIDRFLGQYGEQKRTSYHLVHRIDRDTSGILLVAKSPSMATFLTTAFREGKIEKTYWAVVVGHPTPGYGTVKAPIRKGEVGVREKMIIDPKEGKKAITQYRTVKRLMARGKDEMTWLELRPETGRTHQIRVHCSHLNTPILGDGKYGGALATKGSRTLHLHARSIFFRDPEGNRFQFVAPPPPHFVETLKRYKVEWTTISLI